MANWLNWFGKSQFSQMWFAGSRMKVVPSPAMKIAIFRPWWGNFREVTLHVTFRSADRATNRAFDGTWQIELPPGAIGMVCRRPENVSSRLQTADRSPLPRRRFTLVRSRSYIASDIPG